MKSASVWLMFVVAAAGCGGEGAAIEATVPVTGVATYQGKPLQDYTVYFSNLGNRAASGVIDAEGRFTLGTNRPGDGAPAGTHRVWFSYSPPSTGQAGQEEIDAVPPQPSVKLPEKYFRWETSELTVEVPYEGLQDYKLELK